MSIRNIDSESSKWILPEGELISKDKDPYSLDVIIRDCLNQAENEVPRSDRCSDGCSVRCLTNGCMTGTNCTYHCRTNACPSLSCRATECGSNCNC